VCRRGPEAVIQRYDSAPGRLYLRGARRDGRGALIVEATPAPYDAVLDYPAGPRPHREFRARDEVASAASLASWVGAPVVRRHFWVDMANVGDAIGYVREARDGGDGWLHAKLVIRDASAIADIEAERLVELSGGYSVDIDHQSGTWRGQSYDAVQKNIRINHLGAGPSGWARAGEGARIR
jgi:hypothetical protein